MTVKLSGLLSLPWRTTGVTRNEAAVSGVTATVIGAETLGAKRFELGMYLASNLVEADFFQGEGSEAELLAELRRVHRTELDGVAGDRDKLDDTVGHAAVGVLNGRIEGDRLAGLDRVRHGLEADRRRRIHGSGRDCHDHGCRDAGGIILVRRHKLSLDLVGTHVFQHVGREGRLIGLLVEVDGRQESGRRRIDQEFHLCH